MAAEHSVLNLAGRGGGAASTQEQRSSPISLMSNATSSSLKSGSSLSGQVLSSSQSSHSVASSDAGSSDSPCGKVAALRDGVDSPFFYSAVEPVKHTAFTHYVDHVRAWLPVLFEFALNIRTDLEPPQFPGLSAEEAKQELADDVRRMADAFKMGHDLASGSSKDRIVMPDLDEIYRLVFTPRFFGRLPDLIVMDPHVFRTRVFPEIVRRYFFEGRAYFVSYENKNQHIDLCDLMSVFTPEEWKSFLSDINVDGVISNFVQSHPGLDLASRIPALRAKLSDYDDSGSWDWLSDDHHRDILAGATKLAEDCRADDVMLFFGNTPYVVGHAFEQVLRLRPELTKPRRTIFLPFSGAPNHERDPPDTWRVCTSPSRMEFLGRLLSSYGLDKESLSGTGRLIIVDLVGSGSSMHFFLCELIRRCDFGVPCNIHLVTINSMPMRSTLRNAYEKHCRIFRDDGWLYLPSISEAHLRVRTDALNMSTLLVKTLDCTMGFQRFLPFTYPVFWTDSHAKHILNQQHSHATRRVLERITAYVEQHHKNTAATAVV